LLRFVERHGTQFIAMERHLLVSVEPAFDSPPEHIRVDVAVCGAQIWRNIRVATSEVRIGIEEIVEIEAPEDGPFERERNLQLRQGLGTDGARVLVCDLPKEPPGVFDGRSVVGQAQLALPSLLVFALRLLLLACRREWFEDDGLRRLSRAAVDVLCARSHAAAVESSKPLHKGRPRTQLCEKRIGIKIHPCLEYLGADNHAPAGERRALESFRDCLPIMRAHASMDEEDLLPISGPLTKTRV